MVRQRIRCSVGERPAEAWEGSTVGEIVESVLPGTTPAVLAGRTKVVDAAGRTLDLTAEVSDGDVLAIVAVPHPGTKPI
jgi:hypothetical protein